MLPGTPYEIYLEDSNCWNVETLTYTKFLKINKNVYAANRVAGLVSGLIQSWHLLNFVTNTYFSRQGNITSVYATVITPKQVSFPLFFSLICIP